MASCGGGGACQSHCLRPEEEEAGAAAVEKAREWVEGVSVAAGDRARRCSKCGEEEACNGLCAACFRAHLFGKFKLAVTSNAMIAPSDNLLVAFSGGPASRVALQFVHEMQCKALKTWDASKSQALPVFGVGVAFVDESVLSNNSLHEVDEAIKEIRSIVTNLSPPHKELHISPVESLSSIGSEDGRRKLNEILDTITDPTGKEDFLQYLRMLSLQKIASDNGYTKLVLGSCTSTIACHVISSTVKGRGYSLPADVQYVDARWEVPVVLPLRDCLAQELSMLCNVDGLKTQQLLERPCTGINGMVSSFIARLREENPSRERTIVRTAEKLKPFYFNKFLEDGYHDFLPSRLRPKFQNVDNDDESASSEVLCPICGSPLSESEMQGLESVQGKSHDRVEIFASHCCQTCTFQIFPRGAVSFEQFYSMLPHKMTERVKNSTYANRGSLREQIKDCLLIDSDDGT